MQALLHGRMLRCAHRATICGGIYLLRPAGGGIAAIVPAPFSRAIRSKYRILSSIQRIYINRVNDFAHIVAVVPLTGTKLFACSWVARFLQPKYLKKSAVHFGAAVPALEGELRGTRPGRRAY